MSGDYIINLNRLIEKEIDDPILSKSMIGYLKLTTNEMINYRFYNGFRSLIIYFKNFRIEDLSWNHLCNSISFFKDDKWVTSNDIRKIYSFFYQKGIVNDQYNAFLKENNEVLEMKLKGVNILELFKNLTPENFFYICKGKNRTHFNLNTRNSFLRKLLKEFLNSYTHSDFNVSRMKFFITYFEASLYSYGDITDIYDFNYNTFRLQYRFYKNLENRITKECRTMNSLVKFYIFLHNYIKDNNLSHKIFTTSDGININYLSRSDFKGMYNKGFKVHYYNNFNSQESPLKDRLLVSPNGYEEFSTVIKEYELITIDFSQVKYQELKILLKKYFLGFGSISIIRIHREIYIIKQFLNFVGDIYYCSNVVNISHFDKNNDEFEFNAELVSMFRMFVIKVYNNNTTRNTMFHAIKNFLMYLYDNSLAKVYYDCFDLLQLLAKEEGRIKPIPQNELEEIVNFYKKRRFEGGITEKLEWNILYINLTTNLRINEILNIEVKNIDFENKLIMLTRKGYGNKLQEYYASDYILQILKNTINVTSQYRVRAKDNVKKFVFLYERYDKDISVLTRDNFYRKFKKIIASIENINKDYVVYDLRDTFMTNLFEQGKKEGKNFAELHAATGHKQFDTSIKHYRDSDIKDYLEAFLKIRIGVDEVKGEVVEDIQKELGMDVNIQQRKVKGEAGYCKFSTCIDEDDIDCLTCSHFVTTLDRLPIIKKAVFEIEKEIENESNFNERQALIKVKELYARYMLELTILNQNTIGIQ